MKSVKSILVAAVLLSAALLFGGIPGVSEWKVPGLSPEPSYGTEGKPILLTAVTTKAAPVETLTIPVIADAYLIGNAASAGSNYGAREMLQIKRTSTTSPTYNRTSVLKFDLSDIDESKGRIVKAELQLFASGSDAMTSAKANDFKNTPFVVAYSKVDIWEEMGVTWSNYASYADVASEIGGKVYGSSIPLDNNNVVVSGSPATWDITEALRQDYFNDFRKLLSLVVTSSPATGSNWSIYFHSRENGNPAYVPRIVITQDAEQPFTVPGDFVPTVYDEIMENIRTVLYEEAGNWNTISSSAQGYLDDMNADGSWPGLSYTGDVPTAHLDRLKTMALAYTNDQSSLYGNDELYTAIVNGIQWWYDKNPDHSNWFYDQIAYPQRIGETLVLMRNGKKKIPFAVEIGTLGRMASKGGAPDQGGSQGTGANKMNIAMHWIYRGCLTEDQAVVDKGVQQVFLPLAFVTGEGLQPDYSYLQHGMQLYIGGYGWDIVNVATKVSLYTVGTPYAEGNANLDNLGAFLRQAYLRVIRGQNFMFNALGRGVARSGGISQSGFGTMLKRMKVVEPAYTSTWDAAMARLNKSQPAGYGVEPQHTHFYRADYTLQTRPEYTFELRTVSTRTLRNENGNGENVKGFFLADGVTSITVTGTEYYNIFPVWNWTMIPGTTTRKNSSIPKPAQWGTAGGTEFVGGVSDTTHGVSVYDMVESYTRAKKSYFFFEDEIVCLGAGIFTTNNVSEEVVTTLNQSLLQTDVITSEGGTVKTYSGNTTSLDYDNNLDWVVQGNIGYMLPEGGQLGLTAQPQSGKWSDISSGQSTAVQTEDVFTLWMKHGVLQADSDAKYAYIVVPNIREAVQMQNYKAKDNIRILKNEKTLQAVKHKRLGLHGFVFHDAAAQFTSDTVNIQVSSPCLLMVQPIKSGKLRLHVSDPTKELTQVTVKVTWPGFNGTKEVTVNLPTTAAQAGKSVVAYLEEEQTMPLDIVSFTGQRQGETVKLQWQTTNEVNVNRIEVWVKEEGMMPISIGQKPALNQATANNYSFLDDNPTNNERYYQLRIVDNTGATTYSEYIRIRASINDDYTERPIRAGESTPSVTANDFVDGSLAIIGSQPGEYALSSTNIPATLTLNTSTGIVGAKADAASGTYTFDYNLCANGNPDNCLTATVKVRILNELAVEPDDFRAISITTGTPSPSILENDTYNGNALIVGTVPGTVTVSSTDLPAGLSLNPATGTISAGANAVNGLYTAHYTVCENGASPANCATVAVNLKVFDQRVVVLDDDFSSTPIGVGASTASVLANDTHNEHAVTLGTTAGTFTLSSDNIPEGLQLNSMTGVITAMLGIPSGNYDFDYTICLNGEGDLGCEMAHVQVVVRNVLQAVADVTGSISGYTGGTYNVLDNDTFNGGPIPAVGTTLAILVPAVPIRGGQVPVLNTESGDIVVGARTPAGRYEIKYQLCEDGSSTENCMWTTATILVEGADLDIRADHFVVDLSSDVFRTASVLENDKLGGAALVTGEYVLQPLESNESRLRMDNTGVITVPTGLRMGVYSYPYLVCEVMNPSNCSQAIATIEVRGTNELFVPNIFTPNGDVKNQYFHIVGLEAYDRVELTILSKDGDRLYTNAMYDNHWDGKGLDSGTYLYLVKAISGQETKTIRGYVTIKRY
ncbi:DNRLRE domain-containing protein [Sphingobacterium sp. SGG-5]|uniref:polysaccharide lyase family 8 super-sandwich domain-containing protein n=1 Tax=Sphingobacterium sp. SGG-5 TaxID=2710881 RepID=UPI0013E9C1AB|nr:polysaccharide lyase family 8 super-sandwich domain-containing protein [Sphingobacterium sp. SGG-5]NGM62521.1 DNRLRE domain-containing protein [Sphingobacterium sp. SGG-5]